MTAVEEKGNGKVLLGQPNNALVMLFAINSILFIILKFILVIYQMADLNIAAYHPTVFDWFTLPADIHKLGTRPWTLITAMFTHEKFMDVIPSMAWLAVFGYVLQDLTGNKKLIPIYIYGGLAGSVVYIAAYYLVPKLQPLIPVAMLFGSHAAVMAVAVATTAVKPDYRFFPMINGGIPLWIVTMVFVVVDMVSISTGDPAKYLAHLAGGATGFMFVYQLRRGNDGSIWMNNFFDWVNDLFNPGKKEAQRNIKDEFFYKVHGSNPYKRIPNVTQKRIDGILDKINREGYHFLTDEEKDILRRASNEDEL
ncbi:MAG: rhomboid family intramembrane serine protease [Bacteroidetes bacterium]|nr:rhomboid family intramembrane serine protease [Bacteroidota bacterium]